MKPYIIQTHDETDLFSPSLVESLYIEENEFVPYNDLEGRDKRQEKSTVMRDKRQEMA